MKKSITSAALAAFLALSTNPLYAGAGHDHGHDHGHSHTKIDQAQAQKIAASRLEGYVKEGKLAKSWSQTPVKNVAQKVYHGTPEWVFTFNNPKEQEADRHHLYIFVNEYGEMTGANFTGQ